MSGDKSDSSETSLESSFTEVYWRALANLQNCWMNDQGFNSRKFNQQLLFLIRMLPNREIQQRILEQWANTTIAAKEKAALENLQMSPEEISSFAGMDIVTETVIFIVQSFEFIHTDIIGPATSKEYQRAVLEIPDMPEKPVAVEGGNGE